jgi:transmembrane sensor
MTNRIELNELISKFLAGEASPEEAMELEDWKAVSPDNLLHFEKSLIIFDVPDKLNQTEAKRAAWRKISSIIQRNQAYGKLARWSFTIAATVVVLILISFLINRSHRIAPGQTFYAAERNEKRIQLPDATEVSLAAGSQLALVRGFNKSNRELTLVGSALFLVHRDSLWPLVVYTSPLHIQQARTSFRVAIFNKPDTILISVVEGSAFVSDTLGSSRYVYANEQARYVKSRKQLEVLPDVPNQVDQDTLQHKRTGNSSFNSLRRTPNHQQDTFERIAPTEATPRMIKPVPAIRNKVPPKKAIPATQ